MKMEKDKDCSETMIAKAKKYWNDLTEAENRHFRKHYTTGNGKGLFDGVDENTSYEDYLVNSMLQTEHERAYDI